jgi:hypothetical protein
MLSSHNYQRASRKPSAHAVALCSPCANHVPNFTAQARRAEAAAYAKLARLSSRVSKTGPRAKEGRGVLSQSRMLPPCARLVRIMFPTVLPRREARRPQRTPSSHYYHKKCNTRPRAKGGRGVRYASTIVNAHHVSQPRMLPPSARLVRIMSPLYCPGATRGGRSVRQARTTIIKKCKTRPRAKGSRGVRYARTIVNAHHVSQPRMLPPSARLVRIMSPLYCPGATRGGRSVRSARKIANAHHVSSACMQLSVHATALGSP